MTAVAAAAHPRINLDVVVMDKDGKPTGDLEPMDFTVIDNGTPRRSSPFAGQMELPVRGVSRRLR